MNTQPKITIKKHGRIWEVDCPHCFKPFGAIHIFSSFTSAIVEAHKHLRARHAAHQAYIVWTHDAGVPVARCHDCTWHATTTPFRAAAQHLREGK